MRISPSIRQVFTGHAASVYCISARPGSPGFYSGAGDGIIALWDLDSGAFSQAVASVPAPVYALQALPHRDILLAGLSNGDLYVFDERSRRPEAQYKVSDSGIFDIALLDDDRRMITACGHGTVHMFDTVSWKLLQSITLSSAAIRCLDVSPAGNRIAAGSSDGCLYHLAYDGKLYLEKSHEAHAPSVFTVCHLSDQVLLTGGRDAMLRQWASPTGCEWTVQRELPAHQFTINRVAAAPGGHWVATASRDRTIRIWNALDLELHKVLSNQKYEGGHDFSVNTLHWVNDRLLLSAGDDKRVISWNL